jgi:hypothetical protein
MLHSVILIGRYIGGCRCENIPRSHCACTWSRIGTADVESQLILVKESSLVLNHDADNTVLSFTFFRNVFELVCHVRAVTASLMMMTSLAGYGALLIDN